MEEAGDFVEGVEEEARAAAAARIWLRGMVPFLRFFECLCFEVEPGAMAGATKAGSSWEMKGTSGPRREFPQVLSYAS